MAGFWLQAEKAEARPLKKARKARTNFAASHNRHSFEALHAAAIITVQNPLVRQAEGGSGMAKLTLYHAAPSRSSIVRWMLEELGEPYDIHLLSLREGDQSKPDYLAVNPMGKVPALKHGDVVITEAAAICTYLADDFPHAQA